MTRTRVAAPLRTALLAGTVHHRRSRHAEYAFTHRAWYLALDLDEVAEVDRRSRLLSRRRWRPLRLDDRDHATLDGLDFASSARARLLAAGYPAAAWRLTMVTYPRVLGYVFNPVSFILCHDRADVLQHVVAEVHNTHGGREVYDFPPEERAPVYRSSAEKRMYVSPFIGAAARYHLAVAEAGGRLVIAVRETEPVEGEEREVLYARMSLERRAFSDGALLRLVARDPIVPAKTIVLIAWHAFRLWRARVPWIRFRRRPSFDGREGLPPP
ncbi:MAG: DUF1365 domain-containing protein [Chloroflexota bacterium]